MPDKHKKFHEFALKSILFKGRSDWYFCYLKSERIAHVLAVLAENAPALAAGSLLDLARAAANVPHTVAHFAAGEIDAEVVLADIFSILSSVRLAGTSGTVGNENSLILIGEYEALAERFAASLHLSPFASAEDFVVPNSSLEEAQSPLLPPRTEEPSHLGGVRASLDLHKGHSKGHNPAEKPLSREQEERLSKILDFVRKNKSVSIKDISAVVRNCSEKTVQRELALLIQRGLVKKVGERRWSLYLPV